IASYLSGEPDSAGLSIKTSTNVTGGGDGARVVLTCDPSHSAPHTFTNWFNTSCFEAPIAGAIGTASSPNGTQVSTGSGVWSPKVNYFLPGNGNFDTALFKNWSIENKTTIQLRCETYNTFNHTQFNGVNDTASF